MDAEDLGVVVALGEGEAVALWGAVVATHAEQDLVDGIVGDFRARLRIQQPVSDTEPLGLGAEITIRTIAVGLNVADRHTEKVASSLPRPHTGGTGSLQAPSISEWQVAPLHEAQLNWTACVCVSILLWVGIVP